MPATLCHWKIPLRLLNYSICAITAFLDSRSFNLNIGMISIIPQTLFARQNEIKPYDGQHHYYTSKQRPEPQQ